MKLIGTLGAALLFTAGASAQTELGPFRAPTAAQPTTMPLVIKIIGDEIITYGEVIEQLQQLGAEGKLNTNEDFEREQERAFIELIELKLQAQAGRDLGFSPEIVNRIVKSSFDRSVEGWGGRAKAGETLQKGGVTPDEYKKVLEKRVLARAWRDAKTGKTAGATGRVEVDRYVRPGQLHRMFKELKDDPRFLERLGGQPERASIQELLLVPDEHGGMESTEALALRLKALLESGESTFEELDALHGPLGRDPDLIGRPVPPLAIYRLAGVSAARHRTNELFEFATNALEGAVSDPLVHYISEERQVLTLYRLQRRLPAEPAQFLASGTQQVLEEELLTVLDERRLQQGMRALQEHTFHWPDRTAARAAAPTAADQP